jgi:hypothetical protein
MAQFPPVSWPLPYSSRLLQPAQGSTLANGTTWSVAIVANMLASGTEVVETVGAPIRSQTDCNTRFGNRSEMAWAYRAFRAVDPNTQVTGCAMAQAGGSTTSTRAWTFSGNASVGCDLYIDFCQIGIPNKSRMGVVVAAGDTPSTQVTNAVNAINADPDCPFSAASTSAATFGSETSNAGTFPVALVNGDTLVCKIDENANQTLTISATGATLLGTGATYAGGAGGTLTLSFGGVQTVITFAGSEATQAAYFLKINSGLPGGISGGVASNSSGQTLLTSNQLGSGATGAVVAGTAYILTSLGIAVGAFTAGTGNVPNVAAVTAAQLGALMVSTFTNGAGGNYTVNANGGMTWATNTAGATPKGVQFTSGSIVAKVPGWDTAEHNGAASGGSNSITLTTYQGGVRSAYWLANVRFTYDDPTNATTITNGALTVGAGQDSVVNAYNALDKSGAHTLHIISSAASGTTGGQLYCNTGSVNSSDGGIGQYSAYITSSLSPQNGKGQAFIAAVDVYQYPTTGGSSGGSTSSSTAASVAQNAAVNNVFGKIVPFSGSDWHPVMNAAHYGGIVSSERSVYSAFNFRSYTTDPNADTICSFPVPFNLANKWALADELTLLNGGCCDVMWNSSNAAFIRRDITSYSWLPPGGPTTTFDARAREGHIPFVMLDFWAAFDAACLAQKLNRGNVAANPKSGVKPLPGQVYPRTVESLANTLIGQMCGPYEDGMPILDVTYLAQMQAATSCVLLPQGGWALNVGLRAARHNLFDQTVLQETSDPQ